MASEFRTALVVTHDIQDRAAYCTEQGSVVINIRLLRLPVLDLRPTVLYARLLSHNLRLGFPVQITRTPPAS